MLNVRRTAAALVASVLAPIAALAGPGTLPPEVRLLAASSTSPWTLLDLERAHVELVSYDPELGVAYLLATASEEARLLQQGFRLATADPDPQAGLRRLQGDLDLGLYHTDEESRAELQALAAAHPTRCRYQVIGQTLEGRPISALKISDEPETESADEADVLIVGCHHAREFMSVEVPLHLARTLLESYATSPQAQRLVDERELWIVPILNVDGHVYQQHYQATPDYYPPGWRKNRRPTLEGPIGVDLNRNYSYMWGLDDVGSSGQAVDETYRGSAPLSEPETSVLAQFIGRHRFVVSITYHSFGRLILYPWAHSRNLLTPDQTLFAAIADSMARSNGYTTGNPYFGTIYLCNGEYTDFAYGELSRQKPERTLAFTAELNGMGEGGFWPPERLIAPTCEKLYPANLFVLDIAANPRRPIAPPPPVITARQSPEDARRIHLEWSQPVDTSNPIDHWEVFEVLLGGSEVESAVPVELQRSGRAVLGERLPRPRNGKLVLHVDADMAPLWDYAYVEARAPGGEWQVLSGDATRDASPTGRNAGRGLTRPIVDGELTFRLDEIRSPTFDLAVRLDAVPSPRPARFAARLDVAATYLDERQVIAPDVREPRFDIVATRPGISAYGVAAVDTDGQAADSELHFFIIPTTAVHTHDQRLERADAGWRLRFETADAGRFEAWVRRLGPEESPASASAEWERGDYTRAAVADVEVAGEVELAWAEPEGRVAVLLRGLDASDETLWGPFVGESGARAMRLVAANPFTPGTSLRFETALPGRFVLDIVSVDGRRVRSLVDGTRAAGAHTVVWDGRDAAGRRASAGVYLARLQQGTAQITKRLVLLR